ncbi:hypothetical protein RI367_007079 [Sorochytrium milnesiophthora]
MAMASSADRPSYELLYGVMHDVLRIHIWRFDAHSNLDDFAEVLVRKHNTLFLSQDDIVFHKANDNLAAAEVEGKTVIDLIAAGRVESDTLEKFLTLAEIFGSFDFQEHTVQLIVHNRQSPDEQMIAVFDELELVLKDDHKKDAEVRALVSQYLHAMSDQKQKIGQDLEDRLTCLKNTLTSANKQIGDPALMEDEWQQYQRATELYRSRSLIDILAFKTQGDKALLIMPYEGAHLSVLCDERQLTSMPRFAITGLLLSHSKGLGGRPSIVFDAVLCVLAALSALAYHGMSHNDIKPSNIVGACNAPHLFVLIDLGSLSNWFVWGDPGTTPLYGDGETPGRPSYDITCLCNVVTHIAVGTLRRKMAPGIYKELQDILKQAIFPANLYRAEDAVAQEFWELAERVKALATRENISTIDLEVVKPRPCRD